MGRNSISSRHKTTGDRRVTTTVAPAPPTPGSSRNIRSRKAGPTTERHPPPRKPIFTIGHSTRPIREFVDLLRIHGVHCIADVRTIPRSRHNPQFNQNALRRALEKAGLQYIHFPSLGGLRHARRDSVNAGWRNASFRGFADYMQTTEFTSGLKAVIKLAQTTRTALMCAEAVPWRCHRSLVADALLVRNIPVEHITGPGLPRPHKLTPFAKIRGTKITYPALVQPTLPKQIR